MKKILTLLGAVGLVASSATVAVSCKTEKTNVSSQETLVKNAVITKLGNNHSKGLLIRVFDENEVFAESDPEAKTVGDVIKVFKDYKKIINSSESSLVKFSSMKIDTTYNIVAITNHTDDELTDKSLKIEPSDYHIFKISLSKVENNLSSNGEILSANIIDANWVSLQENAVKKAVKESLGDAYSKGLLIHAVADSEAFAEADPKVTNVGDVVKVFKNYSEIVASPSTKLVKYADMVTDTTYNIVAITNHTDVDLAENETSITYKNYHIFKVTLSLMENEWMVWVENSSCGAE